MKGSSNTIYNSKATKIAGLVAEEIKQGKYATGVLLPAEEVMAKAYEVSRMTIRKSLSILADTGQIRKLPQRGALATRREGASDTPGSSATSILPAVRKKTIIFIWSGVPEYSITKHLEGIKHYTDSNDLKFRSYVFKTNEESLDLLSRVEDYGVDGAIVYPYNDPRYLEVLKKLLDRKFPVVSFRQLGDLPLCSVVSDKANGVYQAVSYMIQKYKTPVFFISECLEGDCCPDAFLGYQNAMADAGYEHLIDSHTWRMDISSGDPAYWPIHKKIQPGLLLGRKMLPQVSSPISVFCLNGNIARGLYEAAKEKKLTLGRDVRIACGDDLPFAATLEPPLTGLRVSCEELGYDVAKLLHELMVGKVQPPINIQLPMELVIRESA